MVKFSAPTGTCILDWCIFPQWYSAKQNLVFWSHVHLASRDGWHSCRGNSQYDLFLHIHRVEYHFLPFMRICDLLEERYTSPVSSGIRTERGLLQLRVFLQNSNLVMSLYPWYISWSDNLIFRFLRSLKIKLSDQDISGGFCLLWISGRYPLFPQPPGPTIQ